VSWVTLTHAEKFHASLLRRERRGENLPYLVVHTRKKGRGGPIMYNRQQRIPPSSIEEKKGKDSALASSYRQSRSTPDPDHRGRKMKKREASSSSFRLPRKKRAVSLIDRSSRVSTPAAEKKKKAPLSSRDNSQKRGPPPSLSSGSPRSFLAFRRKNGKKKKKKKKTPWIRH